MVIRASRVQQEEQEELEQVLPLLRGWLLQPRLTLRETGQWLLCQAPRRKTSKLFLLRMQLKAESPDVQAYENRVRLFLIRTNLSVFPVTLFRAGAD